MESSHLWFSWTRNENIQHKYGFRYLGELLERFDERLGSDIEDIRATALALAYAKDLLTDDMFVGRQKGDFISKIVDLSDSDIYLKGALYRLGLGEYNTSTLLNDLTSVHYTETEQLIFVMSLYEDFGKAFTTFKPQFIRLLSAERSLQIDGNVDIFCWLIKMLRRCPQIKTIRTKDMALFRALMELPVSFVKKGSRHHGILLENGYSALDIVYLNSAVIRYRPSTDTIDTKSIVAEKIAVEMCVAFINSAETHSLHAYEHLEWLFYLYETFVIKIGGCDGIFAAIKHSIKLANPQTYIWLFRQSRKSDSNYHGYSKGKLPDDLFVFDIIDEKWDPICGGLDAVSYRHFFDTKLSADNHTLSRAQVEERISKYNALTSLSYLNQFTSEHSWQHDSMFSIMVDKGIINLITAFETCEGINDITDDTSDNNRPAMLKYIKRHIKGIGNRETFDFFCYFFGKYSFDDMYRIFTEKGYQGIRENFFSEPLYKGPARNYGDNEKARFNIQRPFLSDDEHRELFGWLDDFMLQYNPEKYVEFAMLMLDDEFITTLYPKAQMRTIYDMVIGTDIWKQKNASDTKTLKERYLTAQEFQSECDAERDLELQRKKQERAEILQGLKDEIANNYDGNFQSIYSFMNKHNWRNENDAFDIAIGYFERALADKGYLLDKDDFCTFLSIGSKLYENGRLKFEDFKNHIAKVEEHKEATEDAKND